MPWSPTIDGLRGSRWCSSATAAAARSPTPRRTRDPDRVIARGLRGLRSARPPAPRSTTRFDGDGEDVPLPDWSEFDDADLVDLDGRPAGRVPGARHPRAAAGGERPAGAPRRTPLRRPGHRHHERVHDRAAARLDRSRATRRSPSWRSSRTSSTSSCRPDTGRSSRSRPSSAPRSWRPSTES